MHWWIHVISKMEIFTSQALLSSFITEQLPVVYMYISILSVNSEHVLSIVCHFFLCLHVLRYQICSQYIVNTYIQYSIQFFTGTEAHYIGMCILQIYMYIYNYLMDSHKYFQVCEIPLITFINW